MRTAYIVGCALIAAVQAFDAWSQAPGAYPSQPIRIVVPLSPGGNVDIVARAVAQRMSEDLRQQVLVENMPGSSSLVGTRYVAKAPADGYTLLAVANTFAMVPSIVANPGYDPLKDFAAISLTCLVPQVLVVHPGLPVRSVEELIAQAKAKPGALTYATSGTGGTGHMATELFSRQAGITLLHIPYKGNAQALVDVLSGQVNLMFDQVSTSLAQIKAGKLRPLAVTSLKRSPLLPELPTIDEAGLRGFEDITFNGIVAPAGTSREILATLHRAVTRAVAEPVLRERFLERGVELVASESPETFARTLQVEFDKKARLAQEAGIKVQ